MKPETLLTKLRTLSANLNKRGVYLTFSHSAKASIAAAQKLQRDGYVVVTEHPNNQIKVALV